MKLRNKKTGEIIDFQSFQFYQRDNCKYPSDVFESLSALNEEWEDYKPTEPLIKDEKIRKAVRAWADANDIDSNFYHNTAIKFNPSEHRLTWIDTSIEFDEITGLEDLKPHKIYTIDELCGEEGK